MQQFQNLKGKIIAASVAVSITFMHFNVNAEGATESVIKPKNAISDWAVATLVPIATQTFGGVFGAVVNFGLQKLQNALNSGTNTLPTPPAQQQTQYNVSANNNVTSAYIPPPPVSQNATVSSGVMYVIDRLNSDYTIRETITPQAGISPTFQSGEKFSVRYVSNMPGVVVFYNVDALQKQSYLGTFVVKPGYEMRFPEASNKAMVLDNNVGLETYQMYFMACLPSEYANLPDVISRKGQIPECGTRSQAEQAILTAQKGRVAKGAYSEALQDAEGNTKVVLSSAPYEKGDVITTTFTMNHVSPDAGYQSAPPASPNNPNAV